MFKMPVVTEVKAGEQLTCDYGYEHKIKGTNIDDLPSWFHAGIA